MQSYFERLWFRSLFLCSRSDILGAEMIKTSRGLGRSLVRRLCNRLTICLAASMFCLVSFGYIDSMLTNGFWRVDIYYWDTVSSSNYFIVSSCETVDDVVLAYKNYTFGLYARDSSITCPSLTDSPSGKRTSSFEYQIIAYTNHNTRISFSPRAISGVDRLYQLANFLYYSGYRGSGVSYVGTYNRHDRFNFNYREAVADILSSTNSIYRQIVLSHLSSIQSSVESIDLNLSGLHSIISEGNNINSSVLSSVDSVNTNLVIGLNNLSSPISSIASNSSFSASLQGFVNAAIVDFPFFLGDLVDSGDITRADADSWLQTYFTYSNPTSRAIFASLVARNINDLAMAHSFLSVLNSTPSRLRDPGSYFNESVVDALIGDYPEEESKRGSKASNSVRTSIKSQLQSWRNEAKQQLQDWKDDLKSDLQDWKTSDETGYLNIKNTLDDNFSYTRPGFTNRLPFTSFVTNYVTVPITNVVRQSANDVSSNVVESAQETRKLLNDKLFDPNSDGVNVRIKWPLRYESSSQVNVHDQALDEILGNLLDYSTTMSNLVEGALVEFKNNFTSTNSVDWQPWFEKWVPFSDVVTNYYVEFNASVPASEIAAGFLERGFDVDRYSALPWFERVEVLLAMIASASTNSVDVAEIRDEMESQVDYFQSLSTNVVSVSGDVVGLFGYVQRFSSSLQSVFGDRAAPLTGDYILLSPGHWIGDEALVLRINPTIQNLCRLIMQCIWYLGFLVLLWVVVNWAWSKVVAVLRWLWSMFDV